MLTYTAKKTVEYINKHLISRKKIPSDYGSLFYSEEPSINLEEQFASIINNVTAQFGGKINPTLFPLILLQLLKRYQQAISDGMDHGQLKKIPECHILNLINVISVIAIEHLFKQPITKDNFPYLNLEEFNKPLLAFQKMVPVVRLGKDIDENISDLFLKLEHTPDSLTDMESVKGCLIDLNNLIFEISRSKEYSATGGAAASESVIEGTAMLNRSIWQEFPRSSIDTLLDLLKRSAASTSFDATEKTSYLDFLKRLCNFKRWELAQEMILATLGGCTTGSATPYYSQNINKFFSNHLNDNNFVDGMLEYNIFTYFLRESPILEFVHKPEILEKIRKVRPSLNAMAESEPEKFFYCAVQSNQWDEAKRHFESPLLLELREQVASNALYYAQRKDVFDKLLALGADLKRLRAAPEQSREDSLYDRDPLPNSILNYLLDEKIKFKKRHFPRYLQLVLRNLFSSPENFPSQKVAAMLIESGFAINDYKSEEEQHQIWELFGKQATQKAILDTLKIQEPSQELRPHHPQQSPARVAPNLITRILDDCSSPREPTFNTWRTTYPEMFMGKPPPKKPDERSSGCCCIS